MQINNLVSFQINIHYLVGIIWKFPKIFIGETY